MLCFQVASLHSLYDLHVQHKIVLQHTMSWMRAISELAIARHTIQQPFISLTSFACSTFVCLQGRQFATHGVSEDKTTGIKRFYKEVHVRPAPDQVIKSRHTPLPGRRCSFSLPWFYMPKALAHPCLTLHLLQSGYQILLDQRVLKTPAKRMLVLPTEGLALAVAAEWEWQVRLRRG
jgi:hypothetical protein